MTIRPFILLLFFLLTGILQAQQIVDPEFKAVVDQPTFNKNFPRVLFDEAHNNSLTRMGRYKPFADLIVLDGYQVVVGRKIFSKESLDTFKILVIANPLGAEDVDDDGADHPAFADNECDAVRDWVKAGGSLLLVADGAPFGSAAEILAKRFDVEMNKGTTRDPGDKEESGTEGWITFSRENKLLMDHSITAGRSDAEKINRVVSYGGQSLKGPEGAAALLKLPDTAIEKPPGATEQPVSAAGRPQAIALRFGKGRVVVLGETGIISAQVTGRERRAMGVNAAGIDNKQLALNIMHWLSGLLKER